MDLVFSTESLQLIKCNTTEDFGIALEQLCGRQTVAWFSRFKQKLKGMTFNLVKRDTIKIQ